MKGAIQAIRALVTDRCGAIGFVLHGFPFFVAFLPEFGGISFERCHDNAFDPISSFIRNTIKCFQSQAVQRSKAKLRQQNRPRQRIISPHIECDNF